MKEEHDAEFNPEGHNDSKRKNNADEESGKRQRCELLETEFSDKESLLKSGGVLGP